jgi:hypothetical protein
LSEAARVRILLVSAPKGCKKCAACEAMIERIRSKHGAALEFEKITSEDPEAAELGVVMPPMVLVDDLLIAAGKVPREDKLDAMVNKRLSGE